MDYRAQWAATLRTSLHGYYDIGRGGLPEAASLGKSSWLRVSLSAPSPTVKPSQVSTTGDKAASQNTRTCGPSLSHMPVAAPSAGTRIPTMAGRTDNITDAPAGDDHPEHQVHSTHCQWHAPTAAHVKNTPEYGLLAEQVSPAEAVTAACSGRQRHFNVTSSVRREGGLCSHCHAGPMWPVPVGAG